LIDIRRNLSGIELAGALTNLHQGGVEPHIRIALLRFGESQGRPERISGLSG
jgi:hypothetical protein